MKIVFNRFIIVSQNSFVNKIQARLFEKNRPIKLADFIFTSLLCDNFYLRLLSEKLLRNNFYDTKTFN